MASKEQTGSRTLYGFWLSPYVSLVAQVLEEANLSFEYERVSPFIGQSQAEAYRAVNRLGKVPSLRDCDGSVIAESQAICRYLARTYDEAQPIYPSADPVRCAEVDALSDFLTFSISGPFFNWFLVGAYMPKAWGLKTEQESEIFSTWSMLLVRSGLGRLMESGRMSPFLLGSEPTLPDFHLFHVLELGKTFSQWFEMPFLNLAEGDEALQGFYQAMSARASTQKILAVQASEAALTKHELFEEFGKSVGGTITVLRGALQPFFGHEI